MIGGNSNESTLGGMTEASAKALLGSAFPDLLEGYVAFTGRTSAKAAVDLAEDAAFLLPSYAIADWHTAAGNRAYAYYFDHVSVDQRAAASGTEHGGELEYIFGNQPVEHRWDADDKRVAKLSGDYWVRFARTGDPNGGGAPRWPAVAGSPTDYLHIGAATRAEKLQPVQERTKAATMADSIRKWAATPHP
jgi:para-nitrobenzyl esterase